MSLIAGLHGTVALVLLCALLFAEEAGIPLPLMPGELLLVAAGLLISNDALSPILFIPAACLVSFAGALCGFLWARAVGEVSLQAVADRLRVRKAVDRVSERLRTADVGHVFLSRLIPGLRIYTSLVAGAAGLDTRVFALGVGPAVVAWVVFFTLVGVVVGVPAVHLLSRIEHLALTGVLLIVIGVAAYLAIARIPLAGRRSNALLRAPAIWRMGLALIIDGGIVINFVFGVTEVAHDVFHFADPNGIVDLAVVFGAMAVTYVAAARRGAGATAGEAFLGVAYHSH